MAPSYAETRPLTKANSVASIVDLCAEVSHGSIVAIEGDDKVVSTQLRLLPPSPKILLLPHILDEVNKLTSDDTPFDSQTFVRNIHTIFSTRAETARSFLQFSTSDQPRLVFMNGGCVSARATCITNICEHVTNGAIREAERIFDQLVQEGVSGLTKQVTNQALELSAAAHDANDGVAEDAEEVRRDSATLEHEHSSTIAMKRADSLYRRTSDLEPDNDTAVETDDRTADEPLASTHSSTRGRKQHDSPTAGVKSAYERNILNTDIEPESPLEPPPQNPGRAKRQGITRALFTTPFGDAIRETVLSIPIRPDTPDEHSMNDPGTLIFPRSSPIRVSYIYSPQYTESRSESRTREQDNHLSVGDHINDRYSIPATPIGNVEFGEACIIDVQSAKDGRESKRVRSVDRSDERNSSPLQQPVTRPTVLRKASSYQDMRSKSFVRDKNRGRSATSSVSSFESLPRASFVKASQTTIKRSPTLKNHIAVVAPPRVFTDRGTDAHIPEHSLQEGVEDVVVDEQEAAAYEAVFPVIEDLIIHFGGTSNEIMESVIRSYKDGSYPAMPTIEEKRTGDEMPEVDSSIATAEVVDEDTHNSDPARPFSPASHVSTDADLSQDQDFDTSDPYRASNYGTYLNATPLWPQRRTSKKYVHSTPAAELPTPATTPPPIESDVAQKFHEFIPTNSTSAVGIQNSLRSVLNMHFGPPETTNYTQYISKTEDDRFWKPVFRYDNGQGSEGRTVDQILALGCEDGVSKDFFNEISGQVEKLGTKKSGISRTGKLDIRYLIATAMQTHTTLPLTAQIGNNPFSDPLSLATVLVAPLETYLSTNPAVRFLILLYPATHIATVICLRRLLGGDVFKVSGIIDALSSDPPSFSSGRVSPAPLMLPTLATTGTTSANVRHKPVPSLSSFARTRAELARQVTSRQSLTNVNAPSAQRLSRASSTGPSVDPTLTWTRANYLLPSTATDAEISTFLSNIWKHLIEKSAWYTPEPPSPKLAPVPAPAVITPPRSAVPSTTTATSLSARESADEPKTSRSPPITSAITALFPKPVTRSATSNSLESMTSSPTSPARTGHKVDQILGSSPSSRSNTMKSSTQNGLNGNPTSTMTPSSSSNNFNSPTTTRSGRNSIDRRRDNQKAWDDFNMPDDMSDDEFEKKLMPRVPVRVAGRKTNSRKALKWLGLAQ